MKRSFLLFEHLPPSAMDQTYHSSQTNEWDKIHRFAEAESHQIQENRREKRSGFDDDKRFV